MSRNGGVFTPKSTSDYEKVIADAWREQWGDTTLDGPVEIWCYFGLKRHSNTDLDNLEKSVWDGLQKGGAFVSGDEQIYRSHASKFPPTEEESVIVIIRPLKAVAQTFEEDE